jgi:hypothetical protein
MQRTGRKGERCSKNILKRKKDARTTFWRIGKEQHKSVWSARKLRNMKKFQKAEK